MTATSPSVRGELVERLRADERNFYRNQGDGNGGLVKWAIVPMSLLLEAADALSSAEGEIERLRSAQSQPKSTLHGAHTEAEPSGATGAEALIRGGLIEISVEIDALPQIVFGSCCSDGMDGLWKVTDPAVFAKEVCRALNDEREDGTTRVHMMFDAAFMHAIEQGAEGIEEVSAEEFEAESSRMAAETRAVIEKAIDREAAHPTTIAPSDPDAGLGGETGWLIEACNVLTGAFLAKWWSLDLPGHEDGHGWTKDSARALRFARESDAQAYIDDIGWTEAKPTEHAWGK